MTYSEAEAECERLKCLTTAKAALMKEVDMETWDEVEAAIPEFSRSEALQKFHLQKGKSLCMSKHTHAYITFNMQVWCERAKAAKSPLRHFVLLAVDGCTRVLAISPGNLEYVAGIDKFNLLLLSLKD